MSGEIKSTVGSEGNSLTRAIDATSKSQEGISVAPKTATISFFSTQHLDRLPDVELHKMEKILSSDPYLNGGKGQEGDKVLIASPLELPVLVERYSDGHLHGGEKIEGLSPDAKIAFEALATWFVAYRSSFPDPSETEPLSNHLDYLRATRDGDMRWGICVNTDPVNGAVKSAFSGQVLDATVIRDGIENTITFAWGEHIFAEKSLRGQGLGRQTLEGFEAEMTKKFGKLDPIVIEVDNGFGVLDRKDPENAAYFDHSNIAQQRALWTDPDGQNMAMNPFERLVRWDKLGFQLIAVDRGDLKLGDNTVAFPYNQVPLDKGAEPCETIILAIRISDPTVRANIEQGKMTAKDFNAMYAAMQETVTEGFREDPAFRASQAEIKKLVGGEDAKVKLVSFLTPDKSSLNPEALEIMERTADRKFKGTV